MAGRRSGAEPSPSQADCHRGETRGSQLIRPRGKIRISHEAGSAYRSGGIFPAPRMPLAVTVFITNFGNLAVLLPIAAAVLARLLWSPDTRRLGIFWAIAVAICGGGIGLLKVYFSACPTGLIDSPSGHSGLSLLVYGGLGFIVAARWTRFAVPGIAAGFGLALAIAVSRILLGDHDAVEVLIGLAVGGGALAIFAMALIGKPIAVSMKLLLVVAILFAIVLHGHRVQAEELFRLVGGYLHSDGIIRCIF